MNLDHLLSLVRRPELLQGSHTSDLEALVQEYPFFTAAQLLLLKSYKQQNSIHFKKQLRRVAVLAPDRAQVYALTEEWPEAESIEVTDMGEKVTVQPENTEHEPAVGDAPMATGTAAETATEAALEAVSGEEEVGGDMVMEAADLEASADEPTEMAAVEMLEEAVATDPLLPDEAGERTVDESSALEAEASQQADPETAEVSTAVPEEVGEEAVEEMPEVAAEVSSPMAIAPDPNDGMPLVPETPSLAETEELAAAAEASALLTPGLTETLVADEVTEAAEPVQMGSGEADAEELAPLPMAQVLETEILLPQKQSADEAAFISQAHDRLSWFRFYSGKPLREQSEEVLEQLYLEHMQQDLLQAPTEISALQDIKAQINTAEEVPSSREIENEIKRLAYDSISDEELPASETLARIYEQQQEYKRAIKIYQKLILKFPDKMTYFAGLIETLRQK